jgi:hypothetical protein
LTCRLALLVLVFTALAADGIAQSAELGPAVSLDAAQALFYNGRYAEATDASRALTIEEDPMAVYELRSSALLFQLRRALGDPNEKEKPSDKEKAFKACVTCPELLGGFMLEYKAGQAAAKAVLSERPRDAVALFFLGKIDLNYLWLQLGILGHRTGWNEYWEARHSLDAALVERPDYLRARVARAWIDYIVDTRMPWGTGWLLGGGNKKKALAVMREAAAVPGDLYASAEAMFGLWDMQVREKNHTAALETAHRLAAVFPGNAEVARYIEARRR